MSGYTSTAIPKPKNEQDFERNTVVLFRCILNDPNTTTHGRRGQAQEGVDVYGRRGGSGDHWVGVQCKLKGESKKVTEAELRDEVDKARTFEPRLSEFILITTAPDDANIQNVARAITEEQEAKGLFSVSIWGWNTLETEIARHPEAFDAFHPDLTPFSRRQTELGEKAVALGRQQIEGISELKSIVEDQKLVLARLERGAADESSALRETYEKHLHQEIDRYRDLIGNGQPRTAETLLKDLKTRVWDTAGPRARFRIITNIGAARLELEEEELAARAFLEAANFDPDDRIGMANVALAHIIQGDLNQALVAAEAALRKDPTNAAAAAHLISAHRDDESVADPLLLVPEALRDTEEVCASATNFLRQREDTGWRRLARESVEKFPGNKLLRRLDAEAVLDEAISSEHLEIGGRLPGGLTLQDVRRATETLQELWDDVQESEGFRGEIALPQNLARAYWSLNQTDKAATVTEEALAREPDSADLLELRAALLFDMGASEAALACIPRDTERPSLVFLRAHALLETDPRQARDLLLGDAFANAPTGQKIAAKLLAVQTYLREGANQDALEYARELAAEHQGSTEPLRELARVERLLGLEDAHETLGRAVEKLIPQTPFLERFQLALFLEEVERHDDVISVLDGFVDRTRDSPALRLLVSAYINADKRAGAYALISGLPDDVRRQAHYLRALVAVNVNRKDFRAALHTAEQYLAARPDDLEIRLHWLSLCIRQGREDEVASFLDRDVESLAGTPERRMQLAHLLADFGHVERGLKLGYEILLAHSDDPDIHLLYTGLLFRPSAEGLRLEVDTIRPDTAFQIKNARGETEWFVVEPDPALRKYDTFVAVDSEIAKRASGLGSAAKIKWDEQERGDEWTIIAVKHKWLHALHQSMDRFERRFPTEGGFQRIEIDEESAEPLAEVFEKVRQRHDRVERVFDGLNQGLIPIHVAASALSSDIIEARHGLRQSGRKYRVCQGTAPERATAISNLRQNGKRGCILDAMTLNLVRRLELEDAVQEVCGPIGLTGTTRDIYWRRVDEMKSMPKPRGTLFWKDGQYYRQEFTQEEWDSALQIRESDLAWIDQNAEIIPAAGPADPPEEIQRLNRAIGNNLIDDLLAAHGSGRLLLCQDQAYRALATQYLGVPTSWLQPVLMVARDDGLLSRERYDSAVLSMIEFGDETIAIDRGVLLAAAERDASGGDVFRPAAATLGGSQADMLSHSGVAAEFLSTIWRDRPADLATAAQTGLIVENLLKGRPDWEEVIALLRAIYIKKFGRNKLLDNYLLGWLKGHFVVPLDHASLPILQLSSAFDSE